MLIDDIPRPEKGEVISLYDEEGNWYVIGHTGWTVIAPKELDQLDEEHKELFLAMARIADENGQFTLEELEAQLSK